METLTTDIHSQIDMDRKAAEIDFSEVQRYREYARGIQANTLTPAQRRVLRGVCSTNAPDNVCRAAIATAAGRLSVARFDVGDAAVGDFLRDEVWVTSQFPRIAGKAHYMALRDGNAAITLAWDNEAARPRLSVERAWDGRRGVFFSYDAADNVQYAVKEWTERRGMNGGRFRVVWYDDRIERYQMRGEGWQPYSTEDAPWSEPWVDPRTGEPLGIPAVHLANVSMRDGVYGDSELAGGAMGVQDEINDVQRSITSAARLTAYQIYWATGVTPPIDESGNVVPLKADPGTVWMDAGDDAKFGSIPAGDMTSLLNTLGSKLDTFARLTRTPRHSITGGDWPSGEALLRAEMPLVDKVKDIAAAMGPGWSSVMHKCTLLANAWGGRSFDTAAPIVTVFDDPARRDILAMSAVVTSLYAAGLISNEYGLELLGVAPDKIEQIMAQRQAAAATAMAFTDPLAFNEGQ